VTLPSSCALIAAGWLIQDYKPLNLSNARALQLGAQYGYVPPLSETIAFFGLPKTKC
jgi:hypothetical protein